MLDLETKLFVREICGEVIQKWTICKILLERGVLYKFAPSL